MDAIICEARKIQDYLEISCSDNPSELIERLSVLNTYMARSGKLLSDAKFLQDEAINKAFSDHAKAIESMSPTIAKKFIDSVSKHENRLVNWLDRVNRTCTHQSENLRTQISFLKQQMDLERRGY